MVGARLMMPPDLDTLLKLAEIFSIIGAAMVFLIKSGKNDGNLSTLLQGQGTEIREIKEEIKKMGDVLTKLAVQENRLNTVDTRLDRLDDRYEELRHGEGYVLPLRGHKST